MQHSVELDDDEDGAAAVVAVDDELYGFARLSSWRSAARNLDRLN